MVQWESIQELFDVVTRDITKRMAGIELERTDADVLPGDEDKNVSALITEIVGADSFTLVCNAENALLWEIAQKMKHRPVEDMDEVGEYTREYFNVLCGHVISRLNRKLSASMRFTMPQYLPHPFEGNDVQNAFVLNYRSRNGSARVQGIHTNNN